jgi:nicotinate-nucleotide pyrophosphorylase (carboxylating)
METLQLVNRLKKSDNADLRDTLFSSLGDRTFTAQVVVTDYGVLANSQRAVAFIEELGCELLHSQEDGKLLQPGDVVLSFRGRAKQVAIAEDRVLGAMMLPSGYATRARQLQLLAGPDLRVVCGGWKKLPQEAKPGLHAALAAAHVGMRMVEGPFVYIDKNYVRMFGSVAKALAAADQFPDHKKVIQVRGELQPIAQEAREAVCGHADVVMIDTGSLKDLEVVLQVLNDLGARQHTMVAFAGGVKEETLLLLRDLPVDLVDVGAAILNAPLLDMRVDVVEIQ